MRKFEEGPVFMIVHREDLPTRWTRRYGFIYNPNGWSRLVELGWLRSARPMPVGLKAPPLGIVPVHLKN